MRPMYDWWELVIPVLFVGTCQPLWARPCVTITAVTEMAEFRQVENLNEEREAPAGASKPCQV